MNYPLVVSCLSAFLAGACASGHATNRLASGARYNPNVILGDELATVNRSTLYDAVRQLRPEWIMRSRPATLIRQDQQLVVFVDGTQFGGIESLRQISPASVAYVRFYSSSEAAARFGSEHPLGAIEVKTLAQ
jgi:hypothetical protein